MKPVNLLEAAKTIARTAIAFHRRRWSMLKNVDAADLADEASSETLAEFFSMSDFDRPQSENDYGRWTYWRCVNYLSKRSGDLIRDHSGESPNSDIPTDYTAAWMKRMDRPEAETRLMAWDAIRSLDHLPPIMKRMAYKMAEGANVLEASEEMEMSVTETIFLQKALRPLVQWLADDEADQRLAYADIGIEGDHAIRRAKERHGLNLTRMDFVKIAALIRNGKAVFVAEDGPRNKIYRVTYGGKVFPVAYNPFVNLVLSVLPCGELTQEKWHRSVHPLSPGAVLISAHPHA